MLPINSYAGQQVNTTNLSLMESLSKEDKNDLARKGLKDNLTATGNTPAEHPLPSATARASESSTSASSSEHIDYEGPEFCFNLARTLAATSVQESNPPSPEVYGDGCDENLSGDITALLKKLKDLSDASPSDEKIKKFTHVAKKNEAEKPSQSPSANSSKNIDYDNLNYKVVSARNYAIQLAMKSESASPLVYFDDKDIDSLANIMAVAEELEGLYANNPNDETIKKLTQSAQHSEDVAIKSLILMKKRKNPEMK